MIFKSTCKNVSMFGRYAVGNIIGSVLSSQEADQNRMFIREAKKAAQEYEWLYHCAPVSALLNIIEHREMWLSNLKEVNDKEEAQRIKLKEFERGYYVACFTYDSNIQSEHWKEYGKSEDKVLFGVKKEWFLKNAFFLNEDHTKNDWDCMRIFENFDASIQYQMESAGKGIIVPSPYFIFDYGFYKVVYDDEMKKMVSNDCDWIVDGVELPGRAITASVAGIIKSTHGICHGYGKEDYDKDWTQEKEIRLKVGVNTLNKTIQEEGRYFRQLAVPLSEDAFLELPLKFSPDVAEVTKKRYLAELKMKLPTSNIYEIN